jgi:hypothetical protein
MPGLTNDDLEMIEKRADLCFNYDDRGALQAEHVAALIAEVRDLWKLRVHLIALNRQGLNRIAALGEPVRDDPDINPP